MKLINADELNWDGIENEYGARTEEVVACEVLVENAPTVDAIPIEWIKETIKLAESVLDNEYAEHLKFLLEDWREDNAGD